MTAARALVRREGLMGDAIPGDGLLMHPTVGTNSTDAASTMSIALMAGGIYERTGMTAGRTDTTFTAAEFIAAFPHLQIGEAFVFMISVNVGFALTLSAGTGMTLGGSNTTVAANSFRFARVVKTSATAATLTLM